MDTIIIKVKNGNEAKERIASADALKIKDAKERLVSIGEAAEAAGEILQNGGIVAFPTDTVYGLGAIYSDAAAVQKIFAAKGRPENKPLSILVSDIDQVKLLAANVSEAAVKLMKKYWPGALTLIFHKNEAANIPDEVTAGGQTIGVRMPDNELAVRIIAAAGAPLAAPSANLSGKRSASAGSEVIEDLDYRIDLIVDAGACPIGLSSTVIDITGENIKILREGVVTRSMIEETSGMKVM